MNEQLTVMDVVDMMIRRWWILVIGGIVVGFFAFIYTQVFVDPLYRSDGCLYVNARAVKSDDNVSASVLTASQQLAETTIQILTRRTFLSQVSADVDGRYTAAALKQMLSISAVDETQLIEIKVTGKVPSDVNLICHSILERSKSELETVVEGGSVKILDDASMPENPVSPNIKKNTLVGIIVGLIFGAAVIIVIELFDTRVKTGESLVQRYQEPLLGEIPVLAEVRK